MFSYIKSWLAAGLRGIEGLEREQWIVILVCVTVAGFMMLQGMGTRRI